MTKKYLESKSENERSKLFGKPDFRGSLKSEGGDIKSAMVTPSSITRFLSKDEKTVDKNEVAELLGIGENLAPELL